jgi:hypothetical protein
VPFPPRHEGRFRVLFDLGALCEPTSDKSIAMFAGRNFLGFLAIWICPVWACPIRTVSVAPRTR